MTSVSLCLCISYSEILHNIATFENCPKQPTCSTQQLLLLGNLFQRHLPKDPNNQKGCFPQPLGVLHAGDVAASGCNHSFCRSKLTVQRCMANSCLSKAFEDWCYQASHQICLHLIDIAATGHKAETLLACGKGMDVRRFSTMAIISKSARSCSSCLVQWRVLTVCCHRKPPVVELQPWCMTRATHKTGQATSRIDQDEIELSSNTRIIAIHKCAKEAKSIDDFTPDLVTLLINQRLVELIDMLNF